MKKLMNTVIALSIFVIFACVTTGTASAAEAPETTSRYADVVGTEWFADELEVVSDLGIVNGFGDGSFRPYETVNQAEALSMFFRASKWFAFGQIEAGSDNSTWYSAAVSGMESTGLIDWTFAAADVMNREDIAYVASRYLGYDEVDASQITVANGRYGDLNGLDSTRLTAVGACFTESVMVGKTSDTFGQKNLSRCELTVVIYRMLQARGVVADDGSIVIEDEDVPTSDRPIIIVVPQPQPEPETETVTGSSVSTIGSVTEITGECTDSQIVVEKPEMVENGDVTEDDSFVEIVVDPDQVVEVVPENPGLSSIVIITDYVGTETGAVTETTEVSVDVVEITSVETVAVDSVVEVILTPADDVVTVSTSADSIRIG